MKKIDWVGWFKWGLPMALPLGAALVLWFTSVSAAVAKANDAPSIEQMDMKINQAANAAIRQMNDSLQLIREDVRATRTDIEWIKNELNKRR